MTVLTIRTGGDGDGGGRGGDRYWGGGRAESEAHCEQIVGGGRGSGSGVRGALAWYAVHGTSLRSSNQMVSGDNKGVASWLAEVERCTSTHADIGLFALGSIPALDVEI